MNPAYIKKMVCLSLAEDLGAGDITTNHLVPLNARGKARLLAKADGIICGLALAKEVFKTLDPKIRFRARLKDGQAMRKGRVIAEISGQARALLSGERVALNFLTLLSGIATRTNQFVQKIRPYKTQILDTRKTTPLWRPLERYAVRVGGGVNHRFNLNDMAMIKDNHRVFCGEKNISKIIKRLKKQTKKKIEFEVDNLIQLKKILPAKPDFILLDNMSPRQIAQAINICRRLAPGMPLEASGGITLNNVKKFAATGVDRISIGALTHSHQALDISMELLAA